MPQDKIKDLFQLIKDDGYFEDENDFRSYVLDPKKRKEAFQLIKDDGYFEDENDFNSYFETEKKKGFQTDLGSAYETTSGGSFPKYQGMRLEGSTPMTKKGPRQPSSPSNVDKGTFQQTKQKLSKESPIVKIGAYEGALSIVNQRFNQNLELFNQAKQAGDEQAMAQLQPLLEIDSKKAEGLKKGIDAQKLEAEYREPNTVSNVADIGFQKAIGMLQSGAKTLDETMFAVNRDFWNMVGIEPNMVYNKEYNDFLELSKGKFKQPSDYIAETGKKILEEADKRGVEKSLNLKYNGSAWEALKNGDASKFGEYAAKGFIESGPSSLTFLNPYTAAATSLGMAQEEIDQAIKEKGSFNTIDVGVGFAKAGLERWTENWTGAGKALKDLVGSLGREGAEIALTEGLEQTVKKSLKKKLGRGMIEEPVGEGLNQFASNILDKYVQGKDISVWEGVPDATIIGMFGGMTQGNLATTANHYLDKAKYNKAQAMREEAASLTDQAMDQPNEVAAQALEEKAAEIQAQADEIEQKESELAINASTETVDAIMGVETQMDELSVALETATPEIAPILEEKLNALEQERVALVEQATLEANEAIKALESIKEPIQEDEFTEKGGNKVVDEKGQPLVLYHGTFENIDKFNDRPTYLTLDKDYAKKIATITNESGKASSYKEERNVKAIPVNIKAERIFEVPDGVRINSKYIDKLLQDPEFLKKYDAVKGIDLYSDAVTYVVFKGENIKKIQEDETITTKEEDVQPMLEWIQTNRDENQAGETSPKLRTEQTKEEVVLNSNPIETDKNYQEAQDVNTIVSKENPNASVLIQPKGEDLSLTAVYVGKDKRGSGIGSKVLETIKREADKLGKKVILDATNELDEDTDLVRLGKFYEKNGFKKVGENKYEYDPKAKDSSGDIVSSPNVGGTKESDITAGTNKGKPSENVSVSTQEEEVVELSPKAQFLLENSLKQYNESSPEQQVEMLDKVKEQLALNEKGESTIGMGLDADAVAAGKEFIKQVQTNKQQEDAVKTGKKSESNQQQYKGTAEQQQGEQEDRTNKEEPITQPKSETSGGNQSKQSRESKTQERVARTEKSIDEAAEWLKSKLKIELPDGTKKSGGGFTDEQLIDLVAKAAKAVAKGAIVTAANIKEVLDTLREGGFLEGVDEEVISKSVLEQETTKEEPKKEKVEEPKYKTSKFYKTVFNNKSLEEANKVLTEDDFSYEVKSTKESLKKAKEYVDRVGIEDAYDNFMKDKLNGLQPDEQVALASLLTVILNMGIQESINQNNEESREFFYDNYRALMLNAQTKFTKLGQAVNAIKLFLESMSSPELAEYKLRKTNQEANETIKNKPAVKTNASTKVNSGKKTINEGVKTAAEEVAQELNNELYGVITKGKKGLTESQKKNVRDFFNKLKVNPNAKTNAKILPVKEIVAAFVTTKAFNDFIEKVGELVAEGLSLSVAMTQVSTEFIKNKIASPDELAQARKILLEEVNGLKEKKPLTEAQKQRNAAREELRKATSEYKEMEKLAKELEKERERVEKLRKEEAKKQSERIDKATNELLAAERKEAEKNAKELEKKIKELSKEISQGKALQDQVEDIINEYLKWGRMDVYMGKDNTANQALIDLVKERLGITDEKQAVDVATKIAKSVVTNIREKLSKKWDADIKRQREKETKEEKVKDPHKEVNDFVKGVALGSMDAEQFIELFGAKYGLETLTEQDFSKVRELAAKVRDAETKHRKAKALNDMVQYINSKAPVTLSQLFDELWYFKVLSPALTFLLGTADTNLTYNFTQVYNTIFELPIQQLITALKNKAEIGKDKKGLKKAELIFADAIRNIAMGYAKAVIQRGNVKNVDILTKNAFLDVIKTEGFLKDSITYFKEVMTEGSGAFQEYESPFKAGAKTEFEIRRWFKLAKNGDMQAKRDIVNAMLNSGADALNLLVKSVPRSLAAGDLFFSAIIKNAYLPALVREYLIKNTDLRGEALNTEVSRILLNTDIELENAKQRAVENRMRLDIEIKPKMVGDKITYEIYDKGKLVKGQIFDTKEEANEYARRVVAPKSPMYEMDVTDYLNVKIPTQAILGANRLAGQAILGGSPPGMSGQLLKGFNYLNDIIGKGTTGLEDVSKSLMLKGEDTNLKYILTPTALTAKTLAVVISGLSRLMAFRRVGIMLARNYSNYVPPIGLLRYGMSYADKSALFIDYLPDQIPSDVERDKMLAQAVLGTFITAISVTSILALKGLMDDDDDKDERIRKAIKNIQPGTLVGSLSDILTKDQIAAYKASGDIQEFSIFVELDENGKRKWRSVKPDPKYSSALILATYAWNDIINKDDSGLKSAGLGLASFYNQIKEMGIGQGLPKLSNARSIGEFADIVAQTAFFDNLEITKIGLVTKLTQYLDRKKRLDPHWMDYVEDSDSYLQGTANYVMNEVIPFYNLADAVRQPLSYGALGEEMYRTPSSEQGYISASISSLDSGKNKETRNMYRWLASNGYDKIFYPNVSDLKDSDGHEIKLSMFEKNKLGMLAAKASYLELKKKKASLEVIRQTGGTNAFRTEVEKIFRSNFNDVVQLVKNKGFADAVQYEREKNNIEFENKVEKLKADNVKLYGYDKPNSEGEMIHHKGLIEKVKEDISESEGKLVPFEDMDTFGTALKEAKPNDRWNMITSNLNMLKEKYEVKDLRKYIKQLEMLDYLQPELGQDADNYLRGKQPK